MNIGFKIFITGIVFYILTAMIMSVYEDDKENTPRLAKWMVIILGYPSVLMLFSGPLIAVWW